MVSYKCVSAPTCMHSHIHVYMHMYTGMPSHNMYTYMYACIYIDKHLNTNFTSFDLFHAKQVTLYLSVIEDP